MIRRYGEAVKQGQSYKFRPGVYAILPQGSDLLLTYQDDPHFEVQLPGGGISILSQGFCLSLAGFLL